MRLLGSLLMGLVGLLTTQAAAAQAPGEATPEAADAPPPASSPPSGLPPHYYVEPASPPTAPPSSAPGSPGRPAATAPGAAQAAEPPPSADLPSSPPPPATPPPGVHEPPLPGVSEGPAPGSAPGTALIHEPPPPPAPHHVAPRSALWVGARLGLFLPFGNAWGECEGYYASGGCGLVRAVPWSRYAALGGAFELNAGVRIARHFNLFALWEHAELGDGSSVSEGAASFANTDFYGVGLRSSSDADRTGFVTELVLGYRRFHAVFSDDSELQLTKSVGMRLGLGADIRVSRSFSVSPLLTLGLGSFGEVDTVGRANSIARQIALPADHEPTVHGSFGLQLGAHFDLLPSER